jgi:hypothetical protein
MPAGRPIVSDCNSESYQVSKYIDHYIRPITTRHPSYIKDSYDFVKRIRDQPISPDHLLVTGDVSSLYTNMHIDRIISSIKKLFILYPDPKRPDKYLIDLLHITLTHNDFTFLGKIYLQILGVAMGRSYAPSTADAYLTEFDELATSTYPRPLGLYSRFLDDFFFTFPGTLEDIPHLQNFLNSLIPDIKVTLTASLHSVSFLDITVFKHFDSSGLCTLQTKTYFKPTDTHQLLHTSSFHPRHIFTSILTSQFIRLKRLSSFKTDYDHTSTILTSTLRNRGYSLRNIHKIKRFIWNNYVAPPTNQPSPNNNLLPVVSLYDNWGVKVNKQWRQIIKSNTNFSNFRIIPSYRIHKNLRRLLTRSSTLPAPLNPSTTGPKPNTPPTPNPNLNPNPNFTLPLTPLNPNPNPNPTINIPPFRPILPQTINPCLRPFCKCCPHINNLKHLPILSKSHSSPSFQANCGSSNIIYIIHCLKCSLNYIGQTKRALRERLRNHRSTITHNRPTPIATHFNLPEHSIKHLSIMPIHQLPSDCTDSQRLEFEKEFIKSAHTFHPWGINYSPVPITTPN